MALTAEADSKTFCEFFAGIGLVREGLAPSGWECVFANDISSKKRRAYVARFDRSRHLHPGDVRDTDAIVKAIPGIPSLATASFPCVDLSLAGHYRGLEGEHSSTFFAFAQALERLAERRPPLILLENVPGFLTSKGGRDFASAARRLATLGYWLDAFVLDAASFTPQSRPRVFVVGSMARPTEEPGDGWLWPTEQLHALRPASVMALKRSVRLATGWMALPLPSPPGRTLLLPEVIDIDEGQAWWPTEDTVRHFTMMSDGHRQRVEQILKDGKPWVGTIFRRIRHGAMRAEVRFDGLAGCLRTPKGGSARQIVISVTGGRIRMRWMTPREYARLQGTPDFPLIGTTTEQLWGFADAVCVPAITWIDRNVLTPLHKLIRNDAACSRQPTGR